MTARLALRARADLDEIWEYIVSEGGSESIADRHIDGIASRFSLLAGLRPLEPEGKKNVLF